MRQFILAILSISLLVMTFAVSCSKKETAPKKEVAPAAEIPKDGVSNAPASAERATDLSAVALPLAGAVKEVKAKVLDKKADDKTKGLLHLKVLDLEGPVDVSEDTKCELWKPGSDPEEQKPETSFWANGEREVPVGTWDLRLHYEEGAICKADGWIRKLKIAPGKLWKAEVVLAAPMQFIRIYGTLDGKDVADNMRVEVFKPGTDQEEFQPIASFWSTSKQAVAAGSYDLRLSYDKDKVKAKGALKGFEVGSDHAVQKKTVVLAKQ